MSLHIVCPYCHATNRVPADRLSASPSCGSCHQALYHPASWTDGKSFQLAYRKQRYSGTRRFLGAVVRPVPHDGACIHQSSRFTRTGNAPR